MSKKVKIKITAGCRVDGKSLIAGKLYNVTAQGAKLAVGARRAVYSVDSRPEKKSKPRASRNKAPEPDDPVADNPNPDPDDPDSEDLNPDTEK